MHLQGVGSFIAPLSRRDTGACTHNKYMNNKFKIGPVKNQQALRDALLQQGLEIFFFILAVRDMVRERRSDSRNSTADQKCQHTGTRLAGG